jgi:hypothetical protein
LCHTRRKKTDPSHASSCPISSPPRHRRPSKSPRRDPTDGDESAPMAACPSSCGYGKNVGSSGHCRLDQTSGNAPASSLDRSSTTSLRQPDEVGLTLWDQGTGFNTLKGPSYPAWGVAPCVELGWGIHILHGAQPPCLISIRGSTALPHLHLWRRYCFIKKFTNPDILKSNDSNPSVNIV